MKPQRQLIVRLDDAQYAELKAMVRASGKSQQQFIKDRLFTESPPHSSLAQTAISQQQTIASQQQTIEELTKQLQCH